MIIKRYNDLLLCVECVTMKNKKGRESVIPSKFSERLIAARKKMGITQKELAERIDIAPSSLSAYEHKGKYPTLDVAVVWHMRWMFLLIGLQGGTTATKFVTFRMCLESLF